MSETASRMQTVVRAAAVLGGLAAVALIQSAANGFQQTQAQLQFVVSIASAVFTGLAAIAAASAAKSARESIRISDEASKRQLRAYVKLEVGDFHIRELNETDVLTINFLLTNCGQTPAHKVATRFGLHFDSVPLDRKLSEPEFVSKNSAYIPPGAVRPTKAQIVLPLSLDKLIQPGQVSYIFGRIDFIDAFERPQFVKVCFYAAGIETLVKGDRRPIEVIWTSENNEAS